jgi:hypothetical protein
MFISIFIATKPVNWLYTPDIIRAARNVTYENRDRFLELNSWRDPQFIKALVSVEKSGTTLALADVLPTKYHLAAWNSSMSNRVVWIPWDGSGTTWLEKIDVEKASAVYVGPNDQALQWVVSNPTMFRRLYGSEEYGSLFEVSRAGD